MAKVILGITGSVAAFKGAALASLLVKDGHDVHTVLTANACRFITPLTFQAITSKPAVLDMFEPVGNYDPSHIAIARDASLLIIAPASANIISKAATGIADDMLSTTCLSVECPLLIAPAMHSSMWKHPAVQRNVEALRSRGVHFIGPAEGRLASGDVGRGRMSEPDDIAREAARLLSVK